MDLNAKLYEKFIMEKGHNLCNMHTRVMLLVLLHYLRLVNKCMKFETTYFNTLGDRWHYKQNLTKIRHRRSDDISLSFSFFRKSDKLKG